MIWNEIWDFVKRNIFAIVLIVTLVIAVPWSLIFVLPIAFIFLLILIFLWRIRRQQQQIFDEAHRANGDFDEQQQQSHNSWWRRSKNEGEATIVRTEPTEQRVSDDVGEYVEFKEVKNEETKQ